MELVTDFKRLIIVRQTFEREKRGRSESSWESEIHFLYYIKQKWKRQIRHKIISKLQLKVKWNSDIIIRKSEEYFRHQTLSVTNYCFTILISIERKYINEIRMFRSVGKICVAYKLQSIITGISFCHLWHELEYIFLGDVCLVCPGE